ncbi:glycosyltransferase (activator-dependent family) [Streptosporangium album]|uniref:Glycosyltransferase (Activator-dependent family) n=1 Tax=Streptosporangium album TaxID=47479 RepID=A0A7W7WEE0_9ACTN|nr:activator-dependent family glycosyltransferase [Streptosporangium album]MBB4944041.1 glycosyltransferase (activator-dependent family) [Streptosporangium album]
MRVLFTTLAATSHLNNLVPLAWALRSAGHEVCVASQPNLTDAITRTGLTAVSVGDEMEKASGNETWSDGTGSPYGLGFDLAETRPETLTADYVRGALASYTSTVCEYLTDQAMVDDLVEFARAWRPDLVIWDSLTYAGPVAARASGAAHVRMLVVQDHWNRMRNLFHELAGDAESDPLTDYLTAKLARYGAEFDETAVVGEVTVDPLPSWTRFPLGVDRLPMRYVPYNGAAVIPDWLLRQPRRPRVCLTLGVTGKAFGVHNGGISTSEMLDAVAALDVEVIATVSPEQLTSGTSIPDNVRLFDFVPLNALAPTCSAVIHHGGAGTLGTALVHGVPQLIVPSNIWGEPVYARALASSGAGLVIDPGDLSADLLKSELHRLLEEPSFRAGAVRAQQEMAATPSPHDVVGQLENLVQKRGSND